ncbi:MAG: quinone-dependent dihydroorotate dehydrogenase [Clostridia bacterium]|nr:quinone-dependent dihydroorotate dehydrogenase [Deltaproteobacteria bacterium]
MLDYYKLAGPLVRLLDAETAHGVAVRLLKNGLVPVPKIFDAPRLRTRVFGLDFVNPIGLAAGFDKNAEVVDAMLAQGFGFVEAGSVTPEPQLGNPKPRMFRLPEDGGVINRLGFNNQGCDRVAKRLQARRAFPRAGVVGLNLGKNKDQQDAIADFVAGVERLGPFADYIVINVSSPNTPGLRALQSAETLNGLLRATRSAVDALAVRKPLLVKIAPDLHEDELTAIAEVVMAARIDGLIAGNTTVARDGLRGQHRGETGGLSGKPLFERATRVLRTVYRATGGRLPLIGCGGVHDGATAYAKIRAGASLVQLYTALVYEGAGLIQRIARDLDVLLERDGFALVSDAVGQE